MWTIKRDKQREPTLCNYTTTNQGIFEGDILEYGDNNRCVVFYNRFEGKFEAIEFGYKKEGYLYRTHSLRSYTVPWKVVGNIDENILSENKRLLKGYPKNFNYKKILSKVYSTS